MVDIKDLTAGQMLKSARTTGRRKRELSTVSKTLCIRESFLEALESDEFEKIGELVYILGFARNYALELDLDPYIVVSKIKKQMGLTPEQDEIDIEGEDRIEDKQSVTDIKYNKFKEWIQSHMRIIIVSLLGVTLVVGISSIIVNLTKTSETGENITASKYNLPIKNEYGVRNKDYATVVMQATDATWIQIKNAGGVVAFEHTMMAGDIYYALNGSIATVGNAGALDVWVNGKQIPKLGADHQRIQDIILSQENLLK